MKSRSHLYCQKYNQKKKRNHLILLICILVSTMGWSQAQDRVLLRDSIAIDGMQRSFEYFAPQSLKTAPSLIFVLHGSSGSVSRARNFTNYEFENLADERKDYIVVYPEGYKEHWNDCRKTAGYSANKEDVNDIDFVKGMIEYFEHYYKIDSKNVFATGLSNGAHMCYKLAYELPGNIKGIAAFAANIPVASNNDCVPVGTPVSVMIINGTTDPINPYKGGWVVVNQDSTRGAVRSTKETLNYWKNLLPCEPDVVSHTYEDMNQNDGSTVEHYKYFCTDSKIRVELLKVVGGGHSVPLVEVPKLSTEWMAYLGNTNNDVNSALLIYNFFDSLN